MSLTGGNANVCGAHSHTATQSTFAKPCALLQNATSGQQGFDSGFVPVAANATQNPAWTIKVTNTTPIWVYCARPYFFSFEYTTRYRSAYTIVIFPQRLDTVSKEWFSLSTPLPLATRSTPTRRMPWRATAALRYVVIPPKRKFQTADTFYFCRLVLRLSEAQLALSLARPRAQRPPALRAAPMGPAP
jgi:hypothetical protein